MHPSPTEAPVYKTEWLPDESLIITELKGPVDVAAIEAWELSLRGTLDQLPDNTAFKILVDLVGLAPVDVETHKRYRSIVPLALAKHGWRIGYLDMFEEANHLPLTTERGVHCVKAAHAHQDAYKIEEYDRRFGKASERFFTDSAAAFQWLRARP